MENKSSLFSQILFVIIELWKGQHEYSVGGTQNASDAAGTLRFLALAKTFAHFCNKNAPLVSCKITTSWDVEGQMINVQKEYISLAFFAQREKGSLGPSIFQMHTLTEWLMKLLISFQ